MMNKQRKTSNLINILSYDDAGNIVLRDYSQTIRYNWNGTIHAFTGPLSISSIAAATTDTDKFIVSDGGVLKYRTGAEVLSDIGAIVGSGTINYVTKWTSPTALGNSLIYDNGTNVMINATSLHSSYPNARLIVNNTSNTYLEIRSVSSQSSLVLSKGTSDTSTTPSVELFNSSNFGIVMYRPGVVSSNYLMYYNSDSLSNRSLAFQTEGSYRLTLNQDGTVRLNAYTTDGFVKFSGSNGTLVVDTTSYTTTARTLTINGTSYDLSADRSWTIPSANIYNSDGTLTADRTVTSNGNSLTILGGKELIAGDQTALQLKTSSTGKQLSLYLINTNTTTGKTYEIRSEIDGTFRIRDLTQTAFLRTSTGKISIGNIAPLGNADISLFGYTNSSGILKITGAGGSVDGNGLELFFLSNTSYAYSFDRSGNIWRNIEVGALSTTFRSNGSTSMTLTAAGRLLLGTTTESTYLLDVNGTAKVSMGLRVSGPITSSQYFNIGTGTGNAVFYWSSYVFQIGGVKTCVENLIADPSGTSGGANRANSSVDSRGYLVTDSIGIGTTTSAINASAIAQIDSTTKGFLPPRMTNAQRAAISSPAIGLIVYQTDSVEGTYEYTSSGWRIINTGGSVSGSGTTNNLPKWTSSTALGNSIIDDDGTSASVALATGGAFNIKYLSAIKLAFTGGTGFGSIDVPVGLDFLIRPDSVTKFKLTSTGKLLLGSTTDSGDFTLQVTGNASFSANIKAAYYGFPDINGYTTGMKSPAAETISFQAGGNEYVRITSVGNVGIGTTSPISPLHVVGGVRTVINSLVGGDSLFSAINGVSNGYRIQVDSSNNIIYTWSTGTNYEAMRIASGGNVLIGSTTDAGYKLDVNGTGRFLGSVGIKTVTPYAPSTFSLDVNGGLLIKNATGTAAQLTIIDADPSLGGNNAFVQQTVGGTSGTSYVSIQGYYGLSVAGSTPIRLNPSGGNVLIGTTTNNGSALQVSGDASISGVFRETVTTNRQSASYSLALTDNGKLVEMNVASANNLTVPLNSSITFPVGTKIDISQYGAGQTTVVATGGVTVRSAGGALKLAAQYSGATLVKIGTDEWYLFGDITV